MTALGNVKAFDLIIYLVSFVAIWIGSGQIVTAVTKLSHRLKISSFVVSFIVLGLATSVPEFAVGLTAVAEGRPAVFIGNLVGGIAIIFLLIIPFVAIVGNGVSFNTNLRRDKLLLSLIACASPAAFLIDGKLSHSEALLAIGLYFLIFLLVQEKTKLANKLHFKLVDIAALAAGVVIVFVSANVLVDKTVEFAEIFGVTPFLISLLAISLGTNLPEFILAFRSVFSKKKDVILGDYIGSALANVLLIGVFTLLAGGNVAIENHFLVIFVVISIGLALFYYFASSRNSISRKEGLILLAIYILFILLEIRG